MAPHKARRFSHAVRVIAAVLAVSLFFVLTSCGSSGPSEKHTLKKAQYPVMASYAKSEDYTNFLGNMDYEKYRKARDAWEESIASLSTGLDYTNQLDAYLKKANEVILPDTKEGNLVWSPLNVWLALSMLAETTDGDTRAQILDVLGVDSVENLRQTANAVWRDNYRDDGATSSVLANSIWLSDAVQGHYNEGTLDTLTQQYYVSAFSGPMGDPSYNKDLRSWINEQTHDLLKSYADTLSMDPSTVLDLVSTVYFKAEWATPFNKDATRTDIFHAPDGDREVRFMFRRASMTYDWGEHFSAISLPFLDSSFAMWIILPDEGTSPEELISSGECMDFLLADKAITYDENTGTAITEWENQKNVDVRLKLPKFDVSSGMDLIPILQKLGIQNVFDPTKADFSPLTDIPGIYTSEAVHAARVIADEEKVEAAAFTSMTQNTSAAPMGDIVDFVADRPFLFAITGPTDLPLFTGIVNQP